jgi:hypothetical protein
LPAAFTSLFPDTCSCGAVLVAETTLSSDGAEVAVLPALSNASAVRL